MVIREFKGFDGGTCRSVFHSNVKSFFTDLLNLGLVDRNLIIDLDIMLDLTNVPVVLMFDIASDIRLGGGIIIIDDLGKSMDIRLLVYNPDSPSMMVTRNLVTCSYDVAKYYSVCMLSKLQKAVDHKKEETASFDLSIEDIKALFDIAGMIVKAIA